MKRRLQERSLPLLLSVSIAAIFGMFGIALTLSLELEVEQRLERDMRTRGVLILNGIGELLSSAGQHDVQGALSTFAAEQDVKRILVLDADRRVVAATRARWVDANPREVLGAATYARVIAAFGARSVEPYVLRSPQGFEFLQRVELRAQQGRLRNEDAVVLLELDSARAHSEISNWAQQRALLLVGAALVVGVSIYLLLRWSVLAPIARLSKVMRSLAHARDVRAAETEPGEFADLARVFNALLDSDAAQRRALADSAESLAQSRAQFQQLVASSAVGILVHREGVPVYANAAAAAIFGFDDTNALLRNGRVEALFDLDENEFARAAMGLHGAVNARKPAHVDGHAIDGRTPRIEFLARTLQWDGADAVMLQLTDISDRHLAQQALRRARDEAIALADLRRHFLANMSHELRTPMNGVIGMLALLGDTSLDREQRELVDGARRSGEALIERVNDILEFSRLEAGAVVLECVPTDLRAMIDDAIEMQITALARKSLDAGCLIDVAEPCSVDVDPGRLRQVLVNLVGNAVKFTEHGRVDVRVHVDGEHLCIDVRDTGIGIAADARERIFEPFTQADSSTTRRFGGTGLGLSISRRLVRLMDGELLALARDDGADGSVFRLALPVARLRSPVERVHAAQRRADAHGSLAYHAALVVARPRADYLENALAALGWRTTVVDSPLQVPILAGVTLTIVDEAMLDDGVAAQLAAAVATPGAPPVWLSSAFVNARGEAAVGPSEQPWCAGVLRRPLRLDVLRERLDAMARAGFPQPAVLDDSARAQPTSSTPPSYWRVLVVDDVELNREVLQRMMRRLGFATDTACDGIEAVAAAAVTHYDLILMDGQMPVMDGIEATRRIRKLDDGDLPFVVAVTANAMAGDEERFLAAGMDAYLPKPVTLAALRELVDRWLAERVNEPPTATARSAKAAAREGAALGR